MPNDISSSLTTKQRAPSRDCQLPTAECGDDLPYYHLAAATWHELLGSPQLETQLPSAALRRAQTLYDLVRYEQPECVLQLDSGQQETAAVLVRALTDNRRGRLISVKTASTTALPHETVAAAVAARNRPTFVEPSTATPLTELQNAGLRLQLIVLQLTAAEDASSLLRQLDAVLDTGGLLVIDQANGVGLPPTTERHLAEAGYHTAYPDRTSKERPPWHDLLHRVATYCGIRHRSRRANSLAGNPLGPALLIARKIPA